jgi:DNA primase
MGIATDDIERVRLASRIVDVITVHTQLKRVGRQWMGRCPFHSEKSPSFSVNDEKGVFMCFGCGAKGDVFKFVQLIEHVDFTGSVEALAAKAGISLSYTSTVESAERGKRKSLVEVMEQAVEFYHQRLLTGPDARPARDYLRSRGIDGSIARQFKIGWAPDEWDALSRAALAKTVNATPQQLVDAGLGFINRNGKTTDAFRARIMFPIYSDIGQPVAFGGRVLPGVEGAKYKNSSESVLYAKSRTLYGLHWAKNEIVRQNTIVVCEGYTDVIGFHRAGVPLAVATCGTALTEDHIRLMKKFASRIVLAFDADAAGQNAADRVYQWEKSHDIEVAVARLPKGIDPADLASSDPDALAVAVSAAQPFLGFRLDRLLASQPVATPEQRAKAVERAVEVVNEHPSVLVRRQYASQIAAACDFALSDVLPLVERGTRGPVQVSVPTTSSHRVESAETTALRLLVHRPDDIAGFLIDELFADPVHRAGFMALGAAGGDLLAAMDIAGPEGAELLNRLAVEDADEEAELEALRLIKTASDRELRRATVALRSGIVDDDVARGEVRRWIEQVDDPATSSTAAGELLGWLERRHGEL